MIWLLLFIGIPLTDLFLLVSLSAYMGIVPTLALVILTGITGWRLLRMQGQGVWVRAQHRLAAGELPGDEMLEGVALVAAGALLITPGMITDVMGLVLLVPPFRRLAVHAAKKHLRAHVHVYHAGDGAVDPFSGVPPTPPFHDDFSSVRKGRPLQGGRCHLEGA